MITELSQAGFVSLRCMANRLSAGPDDLPATPLAAVQAVVGLQAQDLPAALLSARVRSRGLTANSLRQAREVERTLVWTWSLRGTLHLQASEDARWLLPLLAPGLQAAHQSRFRQLGWDAENSLLGLKLLEEVLLSRTVLLRSEIAELLEEHHLPFEGQATVHLLYRAALKGILCAGPLYGSKPAYVAFQDWIGELQILPADEALSRLALLYLAAYVPAQPEDLAAWSGLGKSQARRAFQLVNDQLLQVEYDGRQVWMLKEQERWLSLLPAEDPAVRLLPRFDTFLMGYASRAFMVPGEFARRINAGGGIIHPVVLLNGRAAGTWKMQRKAHLLVIQVDPFKALPAWSLPLIEQEIQDIQRFLALDVEARLELTG